MINFKIYTSQTGKQVTTIHVLTDVSKSKGKQAMKFGQLIEYNMRNIFLEKSYTKCSGETIPKPFLKKIRIKPIFGSTV